MTDGKPIFLSYSSTDRDRATELYERLVADGFEVFLDQEDLVAGQSWSEDLDAGLNACKVLVLCATNRSLESRMVAKELKLADERDKTIIPVFLQNLDDDVKSKVAWQLAGQQGLFLFGPTKEVAYGKLVKGIEAAGVQRGEVVPQAPVRGPVTGRFGPLLLFGVLLALLGTWAYFNVISTLAAGKAQVAAVVGLALLAPLVRYVVRARSQYETESFADAYRNSFRSLLTGRALALLVLVTMLLVSFVTSVEVHASEKGNTVRLIAGNSDDPGQPLLALGPRQSKRQMMITLPFTSFTAFDMDGKPLDEATSRVLPIVGGEIRLSYVPTVFVTIPASERAFLPDGSRVRLFAIRRSEGAPDQERLLGEWPTDGLPIVRFGPPGVPPEGEDTVEAGVGTDWQSARECDFHEEWDLPPEEAQRLFALPDTWLRAEFVTPEPGRLVHVETPAFLVAGDHGTAVVMASKVTPWPTVLVRVPEGLRGVAEHEEATFQVALEGQTPPWSAKSGGARQIMIGRPVEPAEADASSGKILVADLRIEVGSKLSVRLDLPHRTGVGLVEFEVESETPEARMLVKTPLDGNSGDGEQ